MTLLRMAAAAIWWMTLVLAVAHGRQDERRAKEWRSVALEFRSNSERFETIATQCIALVQRSKFDVETTRAVDELNARLLAKERGR